MLDSSPIPIPSPKKLKRTASVASLPSPPPSVEHPKKRIASQRFESDSESGSEHDVDAITKKGHKVVGRKLLFPAGPSISTAAEDVDNPFMDDSKSLNVNEKSTPCADGSRSTRCEVAPASPPPSKRQATKISVPFPRTPSPVDRRGRCSASELPVLDEENNPFLVDSPPKSRRPRSPPDEITEHPTMTYVFKGIKTSIPNPNYNLPESIYDASLLPLSHPDYSPLPTRAPRRLFPEAYNVDDVKEEEGDSNGENEQMEAGLRTPDTKPRMSKVFVDAAGKPLPDSGPQGVRGKTMDARDIGRMAVGPIRGRGSAAVDTTQ